MMTPWFRRPNARLLRGCGAVLAVALIALSGGASAQNLFAPAAVVNDTAITNYEVAQRVLLLDFLRTPGDPQALALERLIDERLQMQAARRVGITVSEDDIVAGIEEFAGRVEIGGDEFIANINRAGIATDSFHDFMRVGIAWRQLVRARFNRSATVTDAEVDRAIALNGTQGSARVLISEIFLPTNTPQNLAISLDLAPQIARLTTIAEFSDAARRFSAGPSRDRGGVVTDWVPLNNMPPQVRSVLLAMKPGQVTEPIEIPNALALFQLRALQETTAPTNRNPALDYAAYFIPGGQSAAQIRARVDSCDDLYAVAQNQPTAALVRTEQALADIPADYALELAKLDPDEASTALMRPGSSTPVFLMLCARNRTTDAEISHEQVRLTLSNARLTGLAAAYLDDLRANAAIRIQ